MSKVIASITTSVDGYVTGPDDGPGCGLGEGGERLHYWVFGGTWTYGQDPSGQADHRDPPAAGAARRGRLPVRRRAAAGDRRRSWGCRGQDVAIGGGADVIRQALTAELVDELTIITAPVVLGGGKRLFDGFCDTDGAGAQGLPAVTVATFVDYEVVRS